MKRLFVLFFGLLWLGFWLVLGEVGAWWWLEHKGDALDRTRKVVWANGYYGWSQKPGLNLEFEGQRVRTNELGFRALAASEILKMKSRALLLGPSSTFGWGVGEEDPYAARLTGKLGAGHIVINAGEIGWSSFQGLRLLREEAVRELKPEVVLIAYGVNDLDRHRFYFQSGLPDREELAAEKSPLKVSLFRLITRSNLLSLLYKISNQLRGLGGGYGKEPPADPVPGLRVSPEDYAANLTELVREARVLGARPVILGTPVQMPALYRATPDDDALWAEALARYEAKQFEVALAQLSKLVLRDPQRNEAYYYLAAIEAALGHKGQSAMYADFAKKSEPYRVHRDVLAYNEIARITAARERVTFVDLNRIFEGKDRAPFFVDPVHPSADGHKLIAEEIYRKVFAEQKR